MPGAEPKGVKPAVWHWFAINGEEERPLFVFPGVCTRYRGPLKKDGDNVDQEVFACMTTEPNDLTRSINHERMPVLISDPADSRRGCPGQPRMHSSWREAMRQSRCVLCSSVRSARICCRRKGVTVGNAEEQGSRSR